LTTFNHRHRGNMETEGRDNKGKFVKGNTVATACKLHPPKAAAKMVKDLTSRGCSEVTIAKALGVSRHIWEGWRDDYPEIQAAWEEGRGIEHDKLFNVLFEAATKKKNIVAAMFLLKARHGYKENADFTIQNKVAVTFEVPGAMPANVYEAEVLKKSLPKAKLKELTNGNG